MQAVYMNHVEWTHSNEIDIPGIQSKERLGIKDENEKSGYLNQYMALAIIVNVNVINLVLITNINKIIPVIRYAILYTLPIFKSSLKYKRKKRPTFNRAETPKFNNQNRISDLVSLWYLKVDNIIEMNAINQEAIRIQ